MPGAASLLRHLAADAPDADLLAAVVAGDDAAFAALVRRHGPMVLGVCRRVCGNEADAEDAFQATFVVLMRKANRLRHPALAGNYLYGVAARTSRAARRRRVRRREVFAVPDLPARSSPDAELAAVIDDGLAKLPAHYRDAILLCDLHELSRIEAATRLGIPEGTLSSRLAKGRAKLADILTRRGVTLGAAAVAAAVAVPATAVPGRLMETTLAAAGGAGCSPAILELTRQGAWPMRTKLATLATAGLLTAAGWAAVGGGEPPPDPAKPAAKAGAATPAESGNGYGRPRMVCRYEGHSLNFVWAADGKSIFNEGHVTAAATAEGGNPTRAFRLAYFDVAAVQQTAMKELAEVRLLENVNRSLLGPTPDGKYVAVRKTESGINGLNAVELYPVRPGPKAGEPVRGHSVPYDADYGYSVFFAADGKSFLGLFNRAAANGDLKSSGFDEIAVPDGTVTRTVCECGEQTLHADATKDRSRLVTLSGPGGRTVRVWDVARGKKLWQVEVPTPSWPGGVHFSPDGRTVTLASRTGGVVSFSAETGHSRRRWDDSDGAVYWGSYSADGRLLAGVGDRTDADKTVNVLRVWDTTTGRVVKEWVTPSSVQAKFAPDRPTLAIAEQVSNSANDVRIGLWDFPPAK